MQERCPVVMDHGLVFSLHQLQAYLPESVLILYDNAALDHWSGSGLLRSINSPRTWHNSLLV